MSDELKADLQKKIQALYGPLELANIAFFNSKSLEDERLVHQLEEQINVLVDELIALDAHVA
jgi:hypothetical protein